MIRNKKQYEISKRKLSELKSHIAAKKDTADSLRNQLILASLNNNKAGLEREINLYESAAQ